MAEAQAAQAQQQAQDPLTIIQMKELELKEKELDHKIDIDTKKLQISAATSAGNLYIQQERVESENDRSAANTMAKIATDAARENVKAQMEGTRLAIEAARVLQERDKPPAPAPKVEDK
jgi:biotin carboxyl carrier protein